MMKKKKPETLTLQVNTVSPGKGRLLPALLFSGLFMAGWGLAFTAAFPSCGLAGYGAAGIGLLLAWLCCLLMEKSSLGLIAAAACLLALMAGLLTLNQSRGALAALGNDLLSFLTEKNGRIYLAFDGNGNGTWASLLLMLPVSALAAAAGRRLRLWPVLPLYLLLGFAAAFGFLNDSPALLLLIAALLLLLLLRGQAGGRKPSRSLPVFAATLLLCAGVLTLTGNGEDTLWSHQKTLLADWLHNSRYHQVAEAMPEGQLADLGSLPVSGEAALQVQMDLWQKSYLRGFIAETYTGSRWEQTDNSRKAAYGDAFYWQHQAGVFGQNLTGQAMALTDTSTEASFTITALSACRGHGYLPTALAESDALDAMTIGDDGSRAGSVTTGSYRVGGLQEWFETQTQLVLQQKEPAYQSYLSQEESYRSYVQDTCLDIPNAAAAAISELEGSQRMSLTLSEIKGRILKLLDENLTYDESTITRNGSNDFVSYLLQQSHSGYDVHYATLATLLFRWYGVPARYVEGYYVSAEEAARYEDGDAVLLYEGSAHAWTEYYLDGVGWIPFEATPPYRDDEESRAGNIRQSASQIYENETTFTPPYQQEERTDTTHWRELAGLSLLWLLLPLLLLLLLARTLWRRYKLRKRLQEIKAMENAAGIQQEYAYAALLLHLPGMEKADGTAGREAAHIHELARFSGRAIGDAERQVVQNYLADVLRKCRKSQGIFRRCYYRLWKCLYL